MSPSRDRDDGRNDQLSDDDDDDDEAALAGYEA